jgi:hypothetical protein
VAPEESTEYPHSREVTSVGEGAVRQGARVRPVQEIALDHFIKVGITAVTVALPARHSFSILGTTAAEGSRSD